MAQAQTGDTVEIHYTGKFENGEVFDSSVDREPLSFVVGDGEIIEGVEESVVGMAPGESKTLTIAPEKGYGEYYADLAVEVTRSQIPEEIELDIGRQLQINQPDGEVVNVTVTAFSDDMVTLDANHPLAGKELFFDIEVIAVNP